MLAFVVLACTLNVSEPGSPEVTQECKIFQEILDEETPGLSPFSCMMQSPVMVEKFTENHPGWQPRKWSCRYSNSVQKKI